MKRQDLQPLAGFRDELPAEMIPLRRMLGTIAGVFESFGYAPLDTPALERSEVLLGKYGDEGDKLLYRFADNGGRDVALRYDLTVPLARVVAAHGDLPMPFRRYQVAKVWRAERPGRGRFREFTQCDVDIVGAASMAADAECVQVIVAVLEALGLTRGQFRVRVNNRRLLDDLLATFGVAGRGPVHAALREVDKLDKVGADAVARGLSAAGWADADARRFLGLLSGGLDGIGAAVGADSRGLAELRALLRLAEDAGISDVVAPDLTIARGLDYYTGSLYETSLTELAGFGSVMSGGRYDELLGGLCGRDLPAVGVSLGISRLFAGLKELGKVGGERSPARVMVAWFDDATAPAAYAVAHALRAAGEPAILHLGADKLGRQVGLADRLGLEAVVVVGPDEAAAGVAKVKWLATGVQEVVAAGDVAAHLRDRRKLIESR